ncbi:MAG TPA: ubiquitin-like domain-containing protein [Actinomycetes bacterium]|nr:ubiquitin-like domain-containing protein [Actinomycetes bacterium]
MRRTPWLVALDIALVAAVVVGITGFARSDKNITLTVDGQVSNVRTFSDNVGDLLDEQHLVVTDRDVVSPDPESAIHDGDAVAVNFARQLSVTVDGQPKQIWTTALTVDEALQQLGVRSQAAVVSASRSERLPLTGFHLGVQLPDQVTVLHDNRRTTLVTAAPTVERALHEAGVPVDARDHVDAPLGAKLRDGMVVRVVRIDVERSRRGFLIDHRTIRRADDSMYEGAEKVVKEGHDGRGVAIYRLHSRDGVVVRRELVDRKITRHPAPRVVVYGTKQRPYSPPSTSASGLNWGALAQCESGGNPQAVNSAGYYGLYQFSISTWLSVGGSGSPIDASSTEQTYRAQLLYQRSGSAPWPVCGSLLFS